MITENSSICPVEEGTVLLESVLRTEELVERPSREADYKVEADALNELARWLAKEPATILQKLTEVILKVCDAGSAGVSLIHEVTGDFWWPAIDGAWKKYIGSGTPRNFGPCADVLRLDRSLLFQRPETYYTYLGGAGEPLEEVLLAPFYVGGIAVGTVWAVSHSQARRFDGEDLRRLQSIAAFASGAYQVRQAMLLAERQGEVFRKSAERQQILSEALANLLIAADPSYPVREVFAKVARHLGIDTYFNYLVNSTGDALTLHSCAGISDDLAAEIKTLDFGQAICGTVAQTCKPIVATHIQESADDKAALVRSLGIQAYACNPLMAGKRLLGTLSFASKTRTRFEEDELEFMSAIASYVAVAIRRAESEEALKEADRRKDEFLATLAHELRNPLAPIRTGLEIIKIAGDDPIRREETRAIIERQTKLMTRLIDDLLDVSRISRGKLELRIEEVVVNDVVKSAIDLVQPLLDQFCHRLIVTLPNEPIVTQADASRLAQILCNLLTNAAKFTRRDGEIRLQVAKERNTLAVAVSDNGIGIEPAKCEEIFEMFTQVGETLEKQNSGLGIGLTLAKSLVSLHGGRIWAESDGLGRGSTFRLTIPIREKRLDPVPSPAQPDDALRNKFRVLVVDDNEDGAKMLSLMIKLLGNDVMVANDGISAIQLAERYRPDVVLMDIGMPKLNGHDAARRIRTESWGRTMKLVAITGWGQEDDKLRSKDAGFDNHLVKPVEPKELQRLFANFAEPHRELSLS